MRSLALLLILFIMYNCERSPFSGFDKTKDGLYHRIIRGPSTKPLPSYGDYLYVLANFYLHDNDSLLFDISNEAEPWLILIEKPYFKGDLSEGLLMITEGDSASFIVKADSFFIYHFNMLAEEVPYYINPTSMLRIEMKVLKHKTKDEFIQEQKLLAYARQKQLEELKKQELIDLEKYIKDNNITVKPTESGLYFILTKSGTGKRVKKGDLVKVHYTGYFLNGQMFENSVSSNYPLEFVAGRNEVIKGWDEAVLKMREGDKARLIIPSWLAYGESEPDLPIPPYSTLIYDIEVVKIESTIIKNQ